MGWDAGVANSGAMAAGRLGGVWPRFTRRSGRPVLPRYLQKCLSVAILQIGGGEDSLSFADQGGHIHPELLGRFLE